MNGWIPCSREMPQLHQTPKTYLGTSLRRDLSSDYVLVTLENIGISLPRTVHVARWVREVSGFNSRYRWVVHHAPQAEDYKIIAWKPLPPPYDGDDMKLTRPPKGE